MWVAVGHERSKRQTRQTLEYNPIRLAKSVPSVPRPSVSWELGYDAGDILNPPGLEVAESRYRTLGVYPFEAAVVWGTLKHGAVINRPQRDVKERSGRGKKVEEEEDEEEDGEEQKEEAPPEAGYEQEGHSYHQVPASIYTFVKTDPHGNFKWGVRRAPPVRG